MASNAVKLIFKYYWPTVIKPVCNRNCSSVQPLSVWAKRPMVINTSYAKGMFSINITPIVHDLSNSHSGLNSWIQRIKKCESIEEVLKLTENEHINGNQASVALSIINKFYQTDKYSEVANKQFSSNQLKHLYTVVTEDATKMLGRSIVSSICNVLNLDSTHVSQDLIKKLVPECRGRLRSFHVYDIAVLLYHYKLLSSFEETNALLKEAAEAIEFRWRELQNPQIVIRLHSSAKYFSPSLIRCLEDKTAEIVHHFSFKELVQLSEALSNNKIRSLPILRAVSFESLEKRQEWEVHLVLELLQAMSKLSFHHDSLYKVFAVFLKKQLPNCSVSTISRAALCYALLRIHNTDLLDTIATHLVQEDNLQSIGVDDISYLLFAISQLCYRIQDFQSFTEKVDDRLTMLNWQKVTPQVQIDIAFSLAVLQICSITLLKHVLMDPHFITRNAPDTCMKKQRAVYQLKLLQLNTYAKLECKGYQGPYLSLLYFPEAFKVKTSKLHKSVVKTLEAVVGGPKFCMTNVRLLAGYQLDAVVVLNGDDTPLPVSYCKETVDPGLISIDKLHQSLTRVAILTWGPSDYLFGRKQLTGRSLMAKRHIHLLGFHVVEVSFQKWSSLKSDWERLRFIKHKITNATKHRVGQTFSQV
ncbi:FAST kinase domain-containing protein 4-like [Asterias amurensis]|uniref:FAST kinase domain-containing protein 4-like n=1 Tax=Asterias amurensis TaxID=7602 RepID=UPI003AB40E9D